MPPATTVRVTKTPQDREKDAYRSPLSGRDHPRTGANPLGAARALRALQEGTMKRRGGVAGILFIALFVAAAVTGPHPDLTQPDYARRLQSAYAASNQDRISLSFSLGILGVLCFILFLGGLWEALRDAGGEGGRPSTIIVTGTTFATLFAIAMALGGVGGFVLRETQTYKLDVDSFLLLGWSAILLRVAALAAAGTMAAVAAPAIRKAFPSWVSTLGYVVAVLSVAAVASLLVAPAGLIAAAAASVTFLVWTAAVASGMLGVIGRRSR